eukprot:scaffold117869_cov63-Phaeocystis_antarctica.AAC.6
MPLSCSPSTTRSLPSATIPASSSMSAGVTACMNACDFFGLRQQQQQGEHTMLHKTHGMHSDCDGSATATRLPLGLSSRRQPYRPARSRILSYRSLSAFAAASTLSVR